MFFLESLSQGKGLGRANAFQQVNYFKKNLKNLFKDFSFNPYLEGGVWGGQMLFNNPVYGDTDCKEIASCCKIFVSCYPSGLYE